MRVGAVAVRAALLVAVLGATQPTASASDAVSYWNETAVTVSAIHMGRAGAVTPVDVAYVHAAIYDAVVAIRGGHQPFGVTLPSVPTGASVDAAIAAAGRTVLLALFPSDAAYIGQRYDTAIAAIPDGTSKNDGISVGGQVAALLLASRAGDGWNAAVTYVPGSGPGAWQLTPPAFAPPIAPWLAVMRPFTFSSASRFRAEPPPALDSAQWVSDYEEVRLIGSASSAARTADQTAIARFYGEQPGIQYGRIFREFAGAMGLGIEDSARLFATLYVTAADSGIACMDSKYHYGFWRPVTAIRAGDTDGNDQTIADPVWSPLLVTPAHPEYPSAHGCFTAAVAETLADFFGTKKVTITLTSTVTGTSRTFTSTDDLIREIIDARVYAGIHYRTSVVHGVVIGRKVAQWVSRHYFQPAD